MILRVNRAAAELHNALEWRRFAKRLEEARRNPPAGAEEVGFVIVPGPLLVPTRDVILLSKGEMGLDGVSLPRTPR